MIKNALHFHVNYNECRNQNLKLLLCKFSKWLIFSKTNLARSTKYQEKGEFYQGLKKNLIDRTI